MENSADLNDLVPDYPVIFHGKQPDLKDKVIELSSILDYWPIFEKGSNDPVLRTGLKTAHAGGSFGGTSPALTMGQLFSVWKSGKLIHPAYFDEKGEVVNESLYQVGMGAGLSGSFIFWGIAPEKKTIVISDRFPIHGVCDLASNMRIYSEAVKRNKKTV